MSGNIESCSVTVQAPAKVNLTLRITGRRPDGYHELETLMVPVSFFDDLTVTVAPGGSDVVCTVDGPEQVPGGPSNLAARATAAVLLELGAAARVSVHVHKRIPAGAGLGGGSSDAAAVLRVLPAILGASIPRPRLEELALGLGADVPFFLDCRPAVARGIGEVLTPVELGGPLHGVLVVPPDRVATVWAYRNAVGSLTTGVGVPNLAGLLGNLCGIGGRLQNDFEAGVIREFPVIGQVLQKLRSAGAAGSVMSGSGSAVLGLFRESSQAAAAAERLRNGGMSVPADSVHEGPINDGIVAEGPVAEGPVAEEAVVVQVSGLECAPGTSGTRLARHIGRHIGR